jgi:hypothetical protein
MPGEPLPYRTLMFAFGTGAIMVSVLFPMAPVMAVMGVVLCLGVVGWAFWQQRKAKDERRK